MRKFIVVLALLSVSATTGAFAQQPQQQRSGTEQEQKACSRDVSRHCRPLMDQGDMVILGCLQKNRAKLAPACLQVLVSHGQ